MKYSKIILLGSFVFFKIAISAEPRELLVQWKTMAENELCKVNTCLQKAYCPMDEIEINYHIGLWCDEEYYKRVKKDWLSRKYIDHIKINYNGLDGRYCKVYLQLEDSVIRPRLTGFIDKLIFGPRYFNYDEKKVHAILDDLIRVLPLDKNPKIKIYKSCKNRLVKRWKSTIEMNDLYSVCLDFYDPEKDPWRVDWSKHNRTTQE